MIDRKRKIKVAAFQLSPVLFDRDASTEKILKSIKKCAEEGIELAVFPETFIPNYPYFAWVNSPVEISPLHQRLFEQSVEIPGPVTHEISSAVSSAGVVAVIGVNEREERSLYNTQIIFDSDGSILGKRRKIMPTFHERMVWGLGDGSGLIVYNTAIGKLGALICWEHYMPLARYALIEMGEEIHCSHFPGSMAGKSMTKQIDAAIRHHAMEAGAFVINSTGWLTDEQKKEIAKDERMLRYLSGGTCTAIVSPHGLYVAGPLPEGEDGVAVAEIDLDYITRQKILLDASGHYSRPDLLRLRINRNPWKRMDEFTEEFSEKAQKEPNGKNNSLVNEDGV